MKECVQYFIAAILLSTGLVSAPNNAGSVVILNSQGVKQTSDNQLPQYATATRLKPGPWAEKTAESHFISGVSFSSGKPPALLWHRFSLTADPDFIYWVISICSYHTAFTLLAV